MIWRVTLIGPAAGSDVRKRANTYIVSSLQFVGGSRARVAAKSEVSAMIVCERTSGPARTADVRRVGAHRVAPVVC